MKFSAALPIKSLNSNRHTQTHAAEKMTFTEPEERIGHLRHVLHAGHVNVLPSKNKRPHSN